MNQKNTEAPETKSATTLATGVEDSAATSNSSVKTKKSLRVVVARYNEPLKWLPLIPDGIDIYVSNSGQSEPDIPEKVKKRTKVVRVPNGGRECGHWWRYIISNYENLADAHIFLQGSPHIGHTSDILFGNWLEPDYVFSRLAEAKGFSYIYDKSKKRGTAGGNFDAQMLICEVHGRKYLPLPPLAGATDWGGQHYVSREVITSRPKHFYQEMVDFCCDPAGASLEHPSAPLLNHRTAWVYERAMNIIYNIWPDT